MDYAKRTLSQSPPPWTIGTRYLNGPYWTNKQPVMIKRGEIPDSVRLAGERGRDS